MKWSLIASAMLTPSLLVGEPVVSLAGIQIVYDSAEKDFDGFRTFNMEEGHKAALLFRSKEKSIVGFDEEKASVTIGGAKAKTGFFMNNMSFSEDKKTLKLEFDAKEKVRPNADGRLEIKGEVPLVFATGKADLRSLPFQVKEGAKIEFLGDAKGLPELEVKKSGKPQWGDEVLEIEFSTDTKMDGYAGVRFVTKDGTSVETRQTGSSWMNFIGKGSGTVNYALGAKHEELILVLETWTGREEKTVKIDLTADWRKD